MSYLKRLGKLLKYMGFIITIYLVSTIQILSADERDFFISLSRATPENGLANSQVKCITEDSLGFIWFGTNNGLFCYNTKEIKRFRHLRDDPTSIPSNRINILFTDSAGKIWIGTNNGLCFYDRLHRSFKPFELKDSNGNNLNDIITSLTQTREDEFWFTNSEGLGRLNTKEGIAEYVSINSESSGSPARVFFDESRTLWVFFNSGEIYVRGKDSKSFQLFSRGMDLPIRSVFVDENNIWIGYFYDGLLCLSIDGTQKIHYSTKNEKEIQLPHNQIRSIIKAHDNQIWVATYEGIAIIENYHVKEIIDDQQYYELPHHSVWSMFEDSNQNIWIGTWKGGLCFHSKYNNNFRQYDVTLKNHPASNNYVTCIAQIKGKNEMLIGTESESVFIFNPENNQFSHMPVIIGNDTVTNIKFLEYDRNGTLWIGSYKYGVIYKKKNEDIFRKLNTPFEQGMQAFHILAIEKGLWVCDYPDGVFFYDFDTGTFERFQHNPYNIHSISSNNVRKTHQDKKGDLWFITENGLNLLRKGTSEFIHFFYQDENPKSIASNDIFDIFEDDSGLLLLGTNGYGLDIYNPETGEAENYSTKDGLPGNEIFSITRDSEGFYWLASDNGLCKFNMNTGNIKVFGNRELKNNRFSPLASLLDENDEVYLGGSGGLVRFSPREININPNAPKALITKFFINNKEVLPQKDKGILSDIITNKKALKLKYFQNSIRFSFLADNYIHAEDNSFVYRLKSFNDEWIESGKDGEATFTNISPGKYIFEVKASNADGIWNEIPTQIAIRITPPIWFRWYAFLFYGLLLVSIILYFRQQLINKHRLMAEVEVAKVKNQVNDRLHQMKLQFFTNVSHEFRTPLTLIQGPVSRLIKNHKDKDSETKVQLTLIKKNTDRLLRLVDQLLDFRKIESGNLELNPVNSDIVLFCKNIAECFFETAEYHRINFSIQSDIEKLKMDFDLDKLDKVIFNLLSNAFKFTPDGGKVKFFISNNQRKIDQIEGTAHTIGEKVHGDFIEICIIDTGPGIDTEEITNIFERFYHGNNGAKKGTGIGLALSKDIVLLHKGQLIVKSKPHNGAAFAFQIPKSQPVSLDIKLQDTQASTYVNHFERPVKLNSKDLNQSRFADSLVLVVEDNPELQKYISGFLKDNFRVAQASNGREALSMAQTIFPDIIVSDILMPEMDGVELCKHIKNDINTCHIPVILLTALNTTKDYITGITFGADAYISKPFNDELLLAQIENLLHSRESLRELFKSANDEWKHRYRPEDLDRKFLVKAIEVVKKNLENDSFSSEEFAEDMNFSRTHLHRKLRSLTNQSTTEFIRYIRLKQAVKLLKKGDLKVNEIGYSVGFKSHTYFTKSFKRQFGESPSDFIKEYRQTN
jgi:signal transduction histidine kinase/ligand-binding sensor domain-containing protein/DNA-binding response OmpR family regulator